jgi:tetratricopeptide (TPR) repeat protein
MDNEDYYHARMLYMKMMTENPSSTLIRELFYNANENFNRVSKHDIEVAQAYFDTKRYDEARTLYEHALAQNNPQSSLAGSNLAFIQLKRFKQDNHTRSISYVYDPDCNIGLLSAALNPDKTSSYFSLGFNMGCIDILTKNTDPAEVDPVTGKIIVPDKPMYQAYAGIGWTMRLYTSNKNEWIPKIWVLMSPFSYAGGGFYSKIDNPDYNPNSSTSDEKDQYLKGYHWMHALAPEIGAAVRVWRVVLSYRYQYRVVINRESPASDNLGMARNLIGLGFCW